MRQTSLSSCFSARGKKEQQIDVSISRTDIPCPVFCLLGITLSFLRQKQRTISNFLTLLSMPLKCSDIQYMTWAMYGCTAYSTCCLLCCSCALSNNKTWSKIHLDSFTYQQVTDSERVFLTKNMQLFWHLWAKIMLDKLPFLLTN